MSDVSDILSRIQGGDPSAADQLLPLVYNELRNLAAARMAQEAPDHTLQPTALVHEAYLRLVGSDRVQSWDSRGHFFAAAAEAMRRILIEQARRKQRPKHGGNRLRVDLSESFFSSSAAPQELLALDEVLSNFSKVDPMKAELVKLRFFAGMTIPEAARALGISDRTAERYWTYARVWLFHELEQEANSDS